MSRTVMQNLAERIRRENKDIDIVAPEPVRRDREIVI